jgi:hypothetical protein
MTWKHLDVDNLPEKDVKMFCRACQCKNRGDEGWVFQDDQGHWMVFEQKLHWDNLPAMTKMMMLMGTNMPKFIYYCPECQKKDCMKVPKRIKKSKPNPPVEVVLAAGLETKVSVGGKLVEPQDEVPVGVFSWDE